MVAFSKHQSDENVPPVVGAGLREPDKANTKWPMVIVAVAVGAFWIAVLGVVGGSSYFNLASPHQTATVLPQFASLDQEPEPVPLQETMAEEAPADVKSIEEPPPPVMVSAAEPQTPIEPEQVGPTQDEAFEDFKHTIDLLSNATVNRIEAVNTILYEFKNNNQGLDQFAEELLSGTSRLQCVFDNPAHQRWVRQRFHDLILNPQDFTQLVDGMMADLNVELLKIRSESLVRLKLDLDLERQPDAVASMGGVDIKGLLTTTADDAAYEVGEQTKEFIIRWATSEIAGNLASRATLAIAGDSDAAHVLAFIADYKVSEAVNDAMYQHAAPELRLKLLIVNAINDLTDRVFDMEKDNSIGRRFVKLVDAHKQAHLAAMKKWLPEGVQIVPHE